MTTQTSVKIVLDEKLERGNRMQFTNMRKAALAQMNPKWMQPTDNLVHSHSDNQKDFIACKHHALYGVMELAFSQHYGFVLSPNTVWFTIMQGFATHINQNAEKYRSKFVSHKGKEIIRLRRDGFVMGGVNDWNGCLPEFRQEILGTIKDKKIKDLVRPFSETTETAQLCFDLVLMDMVKQYFDFRVCTLCGIPYVTLEGTRQDWQQIIDNIEAFREYDLGDWVDVMKPVLEKICDSVEGEPNVAFWKDMYKMHGGSGGDTATGWSTVFTLYIYDYTKSLRRRTRLDKSISTGDFCTSLSVVDFIWEYYTVEYPMKLVGGLMGGALTAGELRPEFGFMVFHDKVANKTR